jgi:hypothetical protein
MTPAVELVLEVLAEPDVVVAFLSLPQPAMKPTKAIEAITTKTANQLRLIVFFIISSFSYANVGLLLYVSRHDHL